jgi:NTE family protein
MGSSVGAVNSALIAGRAPEARLETLKRFWRVADGGLSPGSGQPFRGSAQHLYHWANALQTRFFGAPGHFRPKWITFAQPPLPSLYDLGPLREQLRMLVDFPRLNAGEPRVTIALTDIETGELVVVDTGRGERIELDHLVASCGLPPEFAPREIGGRLLGDGGLSANAPLYPMLLDLSADADLACFVIDLYAREGGRPDSLEHGLARKQDLIFGNQSWLQIEALRREYELRRTVELLGERLPPDARDDAQLGALLRAGRKSSLQVLYLNYRAPPEEAGPERSFDYSPTTLAMRWKAGQTDMEEAIRVVSANGSRPRGGVSVERIRARGVPP